MSNVTVTLFTLAALYLGAVVVFVPAWLLSVCVDALERNRP